MNASPDHQRRLLDLVDIDRRMQRAEKARTQPPEGPRITELVAQRQEQSRTLTELTGALEDARTELARLESDVVLVVKRRERDAERLATTSSPKDAQALEHELESLAKRLSDLEDAELEVLAEVEDAEAAIAAQQALIDQTTAEGAALTAQAKDGVAAATAEGEQLSIDRAALVAELPSDLVADYEKRASRGVAAGMLRRGTCEACQMVLSATDLSRVREAAPEAVLWCPECGAILVRTEESGL